MVLYFRYLMLIFYIVWCRLRKKGLDPHKPLEVSFHVLPTDLDTNMHMNNARYASFMDLVRIQFMLQTPMYGNSKQIGGIINLGASYFRFRRSLKLFDKFTVRMQVTYMSPKWIYVEYKFIKNGFVYCHSMEKLGVHIPGKGLVSPHKLLPAIPGTEDFPKPPAHVLKIMETEDEMRQLIPKD